ncbi:hypothetical protein Efla_001119 [Eimeria flavescens]
MLMDDEVVLNNKASRPRGVLRREDCVALCFCFAACALQQQNQGNSELSRFKDLEGLHGAGDDVAEDQTRDLGSGSSGHGAPKLSKGAENWAEEGAGSRRLTEWARQEAQRTPGLDKLGEAGDRNPWDGRSQAPSREPAQGTAQHRVQGINRKTIPQQRVLNFAGFTCRIELIDGDLEALEASILEHPACAPAGTPEAASSGWCATRTEPENIDEEPQSRFRRPSQRQSGDPSDVRAFQLAEPDYSVAQPDVVLRASSEGSSKLSEKDRHRVLGAFKYTPPASKANQGQERQGLSGTEFLGSSEPSTPRRKKFRALQVRIRALQDDIMDSSPQYDGGGKETPLPMLDGTGVPVAMAELYFNSIHATASKRLSMTPFHFAGKAFSHWDMLLIDAPEEVPES